MTGRHPAPSSRPSPEREVAGRLEALARAAIQACDPQPLAHATASRLAASGRWDGARRVVVVGVGKAAARMALGVRTALASWIVEGLVVGKAPGEGADLPGPIRYLCGGHPEPSPLSAAAGGALLGELAALTAADHLVALVSGGASALAATPMAGLTVADLAHTTRALLAAAAPIEAINIVRRHLSATAGGRLAGACRATTDVLVVSDVLGNDLAAIGSGPFAPDPSTYADALEVVRPLGSVPERVRRFLVAGAAGREPETLPPGDPAFDRVCHHLLATPETLLDAATTLAPQFGFSDVRRLAPSGERVERVAAEWLTRAESLAPAGLLVGGGEPTVRLPAEPGRGGRNQQLALLVARGLAGLTPGFRGDCGPVVLVLGSDGEDGPTDAAGAWVDQTTWERIGRAGIDPAVAVRRADAYGALDGVGALVRTGPTGTNVLDLHLVTRCDGSPAPGGTKAIR